MQLFIPEKIEFVLKTLKNANFDAFIVGGCVRDMLSNKVPHDYDITTSAKPCEIEKLFEKTAPTGIKHGTVTVICDGIPIEVTTFRTEGNYTDSRHPDSVEFVTDIKYDLSRRDFTVNAMAFNNTDGLIDLFGGKEDLENRILRAVGNPEKRFCEDALRILRLFRFASVLNFKIEENTLIAAKKCAGLLKNVSCERILSELTKAVAGKNTAVLKEFADTGALKFINITGCDDTDKIRLLSENSNLRLFAFLKLSHCDILKVLKNLKASNSTTKYCDSLIKLCSAKLPYTKSEIKRLLRNCEISEFNDYLAFINIFEGTDISLTSLLTKEILEKNEPYRTEHLNISGNDIINLGYTGSEISAALKKALDFVIENPDKNSIEILTDFLSN